MKTIMFKTEESLLIASSFDKRPNSFKDIENNLKKLGMVPHKDMMTDFGFFTLNTVIDENKFLSSKLPEFIKKKLNDPKCIYENYNTVTGEYLIKE